MPQVVRTANDVIVNALELISELGVGETPDGFMLSTGISLINELLDKFSSDSIFIPFLTTLNFDFIAGKDTYSISDMTPSDITADRVVDLSFANYLIPSGGSVQLSYPLRIISKAQYYNVVRQTSNLARPGYIFLDKQANQSFVTVYSTPDQPYPCSLKVKSMIDFIENQDTLMELPPVYGRFLKYCLGKDFNGYYPSSNWTDRMEKELSDLYDIITATNETDLTIRPSSIGSSKEPYFWQNILSY